MSGVRFSAGAPKNGTPLRCSVFCCFCSKSLRCLPRKRGVRKIAARSRQARRPLSLSPLNFLPQILRTEHHYGVPFFAVPAPNRSVVCSANREFAYRFSGILRYADSAFQVKLGWDNYRRFAPHSKFSARNTTTVFRFLLFLLQIAPPFAQQTRSSHTALAVYCGTVSPSETTTFPQFSAFPCRKFSAGALFYYAFFDFSHNVFLI